MRSSEPQTPSHPTGIVKSPLDVQAQLTQLENDQFVRRLNDEELTYIFKHVLVRDTAYESLLKQQRRQLHRVVADTLERAYPAQLDDYAALLAHHFAEAGEYDKTIAYARRAARRAVERYAYGEASQQLERALDLTDAASQLRVELLEELGDVKRLMREGKRAVSHYRQALAVCQGIAVSDPYIVARMHRKIIETLSEIKWAITMADFYVESRTSLSSLTSLESELRSMKSAPHAEMVRLLTALSIASWRIQMPPDWDAAQRYAESAVAAAEELNDSIELSAPLDALATVYFVRGLLRENVAVALRRLAIHRDRHFDDERQSLDSLRSAGSALMYVGEYADAIPYFLQAEATAQRIQAINQVFNNMSLLAQCYFRLDRWDDVEGTLAQIHGLGRIYPREKTGPT